MIEVENTDVNIVRNLIPMRNHMPASAYGLKAISDWFDSGHTFRIAISWVPQILLTTACTWVQIKFFKNDFIKKLYFQTLSKLKHVHQLVIELKHLERTDIEHRAFARLTKLLIEQTQTSFFWTSHGLESVYPIFGFNQLNIKFET